MQSFQSKGTITNIYLHFPIHVLSSLTSFTIDRGPYLHHRDGDHVNKISRYIVCDALAYRYFE